MKPVAAILLAFCAVSLPAQRLTIVLDPARGGSEYGVRIDERTYEKQVTLDLANRLRFLLNARDFNVVLTREGDTVVSNEARATVANQNKSVACLLLHTTASGTGLHLFTSSLTATPPNSTGVLWDEAQAPFVQRSQRLANELSTAFSRSKIPVSSAATWIRPLDNMQCPAVAIEIAPESDGTRSSNHGYQNRIADAIAGAMLFWRGHQDVMESIMGPPPAPPTPKPATETAEPKSAPASTGVNPESTGVKQPATQQKSAAGSTTPGAGQSQSAQPTTAKPKVATPKTAAPTGSEPAYTPPGSVAPGSVAPKTSPPKSLTPKTVSPSPALPSSTPPKPVTPKAVTPKPPVPTRPVDPDGQIVE